MDAPDGIAVQLRQQGLSVEELSEKVEIPAGRLEALLKGESPTVSELLKISNAFNVSIHQLVEGEIISREMQSFPLIEGEAEAGLGRNHDDPDFFKKLDSYRIPGFSGDGIVIFRVHGDSMKPSISPEDYLVCQKLKSPDELADKAIAVVVVGKHVLVKRLWREDGCWIMHSDNGDIKDINIEASKIAAIWAVIGKVTSDFLTSTREEHHKISSMKRELAHLKNEIEVLKTAFEEVLAQLKKGKK